jgi:hypothetical protein
MKKKLWIIWAVWFVAYIAAIQFFRFKFGIFKISAAIVIIGVLLMLLAERFSRPKSD